MLIDQFQRNHTYMRLSLTDRCNLRCVYCMPPEGLSWMPSDNILQQDEIIYLAGILSDMGIEHIRLTGGEPTIRKDLLEIISGLAALPKIKELSMTTNGLHLNKLAQPLFDAGLNRINISIDSLQPEKFSKLTRGGSLSKVLDGIEAALNTGFSKIKLNMVVIPDENTDELLDMIAFCEQEPSRLEIRFIEVMPFGKRQFACFTAAQIQDVIQAQYTMQPIQNPLSRGPARHFQLSENKVIVGFISPLSNQFCATCNRLRLMADGSLRACLAKEKRPSLREVIRQPHQIEDVQRLIQQIVWNKVDGHHCSEDGGTPFEGIMRRIGG